jgi:hypothetical protein
MYPLVLASICPETSFEFFNSPPIPYEENMSATISVHGNIYRWIQRPLLDSVDRQLLSSQYAINHLV